MNSHMRNRCCGRRRNSRRAVALAELGLCLPLLLLVALGSIEASNAIYLEEHLTSAAYEAARSATAPGQTTAGAAAAANTVLVQFKITGGVVTITPDLVNLTPTGTVVRVTVSAPFAANSPTSFVFGKIVTNLTANAVMVRQ
jgi:Flp pilus assembly protein TadG